MDIEDHFRRLLDYDYWANRETLSSMKAAGQPAGRSLQLFSHLIAAEGVWIERVTGKKRGVAVWPELTLEQCEAELAAVRSAWRDYLNGPAGSDAQRIVTYTNTKGEAWQSTLAEILTQMILHSAYHRGQIASEVRMSGNTPAYTDFIHCARQGYID